MGAVTAGGEDAGGTGGHQGVHDEQASDEAEEAEKTAAGSSQIGCEKEEEELGGGFGAEAMDDSDEKDRTAIVAERKGFGLRGARVAKAPDAPGGMLDSGDQECDAAWGDEMRVASLLASDKADEDVDGEDDECGSDEALADGVEMGREAKVEEDDCGSEDSDREGMTESVEEAKAHAFTPGALDAGDVSDSGEMVVVEAVAQAEKGAGEQGEFERGGHWPSGRVRVAGMARKLAACNL